MNIDMSKDRKKIFFQVVLFFVFLFFFMTWPGNSHTAGAPTATTNAAGAVQTTGATLNGTVNANNADTTVTFQYGPTIAYGTSVTATQSPVTGNSDTAVSQGITGLTPNTPYHFRVVGVNAVGTTNGGDLFFSTRAALPIATTNAASDVTTSGATLNGTVNANNAGTTVTFEYGLTTAYGTTVTADQSPVLGTIDTAVSTAITGLTQNTTYYFRVVGVNIAGTTNGSDLTFTTTAAVPTVTTNAASGITAMGATLNGTVNANNASITVTFEYGLTTAYGSTVTADQSPVTGNSDTAVSKTLTGLTANTTYHYRVVGANSSVTTNGSDMTFITSTSGAFATVTTNAASGITTSGATLNGTVNANNASTTVTFQYGLSTEYESTVTADQSPVTGSSNTAVSKTITGLSANTTYHYRAVGVNSAGITYGGDLTFTTSTSATAPTVTTNAASGVTNSGAILNGTVNANNASTTVTFQYGLSTEYESTVTADQSPVTGNSNTAVSKAITGLTPNTTYHFRVVGVNSSGTTYGGDLTFATSSCTFSINPTSASGVAAGGSGSVTVTAPSGCSGTVWTATSNVSWISITSGSSGTGSGTVNYSYLAYTTTASADTTASSRSGTITIAGQTFTLTQASQSINLVKIGVFRNGAWYLDNNDNMQWDNCTTDQCLAFGMTGDTPVVGDWDGNGTAKIGIFRNGIWVLDNNGNGEFDNCTTDPCNGFGMPGDTPVVGDWDGSGRSKIGIFRNGIWVLDYNGNEQFDDCTTDHCLGFGMTGDTPVVGDWDGSGTAKIGIFRDGLWVLDYNGNGQFDDCTTDICIGFGMTGDHPVTGQW